MAVFSRPGLFLFILATTACNHPNPVRIQRPVSTPDPDSLIRINRQMIMETKELILKKEQQSGWKLKETGTGLFYQIYADARFKNSVKTATGNKSRLIKSGDWVSLSYTVRLLDGKKCYDSRFDGPKQFIVEGSPAERGLHEAVQLFAKGDSARIILPPHLAFGLAGDGDRIPGRAILWYEIRVDSVRPGTNN